MNLKICKKANLDIMNCPQSIKCSNLIMSAFHLNGEVVGICDQTKGITNINKYLSNTVNFHEVIE